MQNDKEFVSKSHMRSGCCAVGSGEHHPSQVLNANEHKFKGVTVRCVNPKGELTWAPYNNFIKRPTDTPADKKPANAQAAQLQWWVERATHGGREVWAVRSCDLDLAEKCKKFGMDGTAVWAAKQEYQLKVSLFRHWCDEVRVDAGTAADKVVILVDPNADQGEYKGPLDAIKRAFSYEPIAQPDGAPDITLTKEMLLKRFVVEIKDQTKAKEDFGGVERQVFTDAFKSAYTEMGLLEQARSGDHKAVYEAHPRQVFFEQELELRALRAGKILDMPDGDEKKAAQGALAAREAKISTEELERHIAERTGTFKMLGRFLGKCLFDGIPVAAHLSRMDFKHLQGKKQMLSDLWYVDDTKLDMMKEVLQMEDEEQIADLCLQFTTEQVMPPELLPLYDGTIAGCPMANEGKVEVPVVDDEDPHYGQDVTMENREAAADAFEKYYLGLAEPERDALAEGFQEVIPGSWIAIYTAAELDVLLCGQDTVDVLDWIKHTVYSQEYADAKELQDRALAAPVLAEADDEKLNKQVVDLVETVTVDQVKWFWQTVVGMTHQQRRQLLSFSTGTASLPANGFAGLQSKAGASHPFHVTSIDMATSSWPRAHTCFNKIDLPMYESFEKVRDTLTMVIGLDSGFGMGE